MLAYNRDGVHNKTLFKVYGDPQTNPGNEHGRVLVLISGSMIDYENAFAPLAEVSKIVYNQCLPADLFQLNRAVAG